MRGPQVAARWGVVQASELLGVGGHGGGRLLGVYLLCRVRYRLLLEVRVVHLLLHLLLLRRGQVRRCVAHGDEDPVAQWGEGLLLYGGELGGDCGFFSGKDIPVR